MPDAGLVGNGAAFFDYDGDGDLDLYLVRRGLADQMWRNDGGAFVDDAGPAGLARAVQARVDKEEGA